MDIGFVGLGKMGAGMADNILRAGHALTVFTRRKETAKPILDRGAAWADNPKEVARASRMVFTCLPGPKEVEAVALGTNGIIEGIRPDGVYIDLSTITPQLARRIHQAFREKGAHVMDAPVSGGPPLAWAGKLAVMAGGDEEVYVRCEPVLRAIGDKVGYTGAIGSGSICKNMQVGLLYAMLPVIAECFTLGVKAGVKPKALWRAIRDSQSGSGALFRQTFPDTWFQNRFDPPSMSLRLAIKDLDQAIALGREFEVPTAMLNLTLQEFLAARNRGWGEKDVRITALLQEERAGNVEVRIPVEEMKQEGYQSVEKW